MGASLGTAPYHPQLLVKVLFYAYAGDSGLQIARHENVAFRVLASNQVSNDQRLSGSIVAELFVQVLTLCSGRAW
jgi:hypothetical protein